MQLNHWRPAVALPVAIIVVLVAAALTVPPAWAGTSSGVIKMQPPADTSNFCPQTSTTLSAGVPTRAEYVAMLQDLMDRYGAMAGPALDSLDQSLAEMTKPADGAQMGVALLMVGAGSASVYTTARGAALDPDDASTATSLAMALNSMEDYQTALRVLLYADSLAPNSPVVLSAMGTIYFQAGDKFNARNAFTKAMVFSPDYVPALNGLGVLSVCEDDFKGAVKYLLRSLSSNFSSAGQQALSYAQASIAQSQEQATSPEPPRMEKAPNAAYDFPKPPLSGDFDQAKAVKDSIDNYRSSVMMPLIEQKVTESFNLYDQALQSSAIDITADRIVMKRTYADEDYHLWELRRYFFGDWNMQGKLQKDFEPVDKKFIDIYLAQGDAMWNTAQQCQQKYDECSPPCPDSQNEAYCDWCNAQAEYWCCDNFRKTMTSFWPEYYANWQEGFQIHKAVLEDFYGFSSSVIEKIYDPLYNKAFNAWRETAVIENIDLTLAEAYMVSDFGTTYPAYADYYENMTCVPPPPPPPIVSEPPAVASTNSSDCLLGDETYKVGGFGASFEFDCTKATAEFTQGVSTSLTIDSKKKQNTFFVGMGDSAGNSLSGGFGGKAGVYITGDSNWAIADAGMKASTSIQGGGLEAEETLTYSVVEGPSTEKSIKWCFDIGDPL